MHAGGDPLSESGRDRWPSAKDLAVAEMEVAAVRVVPLPRRFTSWGVVEVDRIHHVSDVGMIHFASHSTNLTFTDATTGTNRADIAISTSAAGFVIRLT